jgi:hypothetical protein
MDVRRLSRVELMLWVRGVTRTCCACSICVKLLCFLGLLGFCVILSARLEFQLEVKSIF